MLVAVLIPYLLGIFNLQPSLGLFAVFRPSLSSPVPVLTGEKTTWLGSGMKYVWLHGRGALCTALISFPGDPNCGLDGTLGLSQINILELNCASPCLSPWGDYVCEYIKVRSGECPWGLLSRLLNWAYFFQRAGSFFCSYGTIRGRQNQAQ